jgi:hypothetical protein
VAHAIHRMLVAGCVLRDPLFAGLAAPHIPECYTRFVQNRGANWLILRQLGGLVVLSDNNVGWVSEKGGNWRM